MSYYKNILFIAVVLSSFYGCGGSSDECNDSVACIQADPESIVDSSALLGAYNTEFKLYSNSCLGALPSEQLSESYVVTSGFGYHGISTIDVSNNIGHQYQNFSTVGNTDGKTYFKVFEVGDQELSNFVPNMICSESIRLEFYDVGPAKASITRISEIDCVSPGETIVQGISAHCQVIYEGISSTRE